jgi:type I restriction enzyme R subunit
LRFVEALDGENLRALREGLDEESLAIFDILRKPALDKKDVERVKAIAGGLLTKLKTEQLRIERWRDRENTRDAVHVSIRDYLYADATGLPLDAYDEKEVFEKADAVFAHVYRVYPTVPSPFFPAQVV